MEVYCRSTWSLMLPFWSWLTSCAISFHFIWLSNAIFTRTVSVPTLLNGNRKIKYMFVPLLYHRIPAVLQSCLFELYYKQWDPEEMCLSCSNKYLNFQQLEHTKDSAWVHFLFLKRWWLCDGAINTLWVWILSGQLYLITFTLLVVILILDWSQLVQQELVPVQEKHLLYISLLLKGTSMNFSLACFRWRKRLS